jgi:hypothetical protein
MGAECRQAGETGDKKANALGKGVSFFHWNGVILSNDLRFDNGLADRGRMTRRGV